MSDNEKKQIEKDTLIQQIWDLRSQLETKEKEDNEEKEEKQNELLDKYGILLSQVQAQAETIEKLKKEATNKNLLQLEERLKKTIESYNTSVSILQRKLKSITDELKTEIDKNKVE